MRGVVDAKYDQRHVPVLIDDCGQQILQTVSRHRAIAAGGLPVDRAPKLLCELTGELPGKGVFLTLDAYARHRRLTNQQQAQRLVLRAIRRRDQTFPRLLRIRQAQRCAFDPERLRQQQR